MDLILYPLRRRELFDAGSVLLCGLIQLLHRGADSMIPSLL